MSDVHGFYDEMIKALTEAGYFDYKGPKKLVVCGDMFDRGKQVVEMQKFMCDLFDKDELIFIKGNHEELFCSLVEHFGIYASGIFDGSSHHISNGTLRTMLCLAERSDTPPASVFWDLFDVQRERKVIEKAKASDYYSKLIPASVDYFETDNYIFVHGWIPYTADYEHPVQTEYGDYVIRNVYDPNWRNADEGEWSEARWKNGMALCELEDVRERGKTIVCGHYHASWGHVNLEQKGEEFGDNADYSPYVGKGIVCIDACTAASGKVNCFVIDD